MKNLNSKIAMSFVVVSAIAFQLPAQAQTSTKTEIRSTETTQPSKNGKKAETTQSVEAKTTSVKKSESSSNSKGGTSVEGADAGGKVFEVASGKTEFFSIGKPSMLKIHGTSTDLKGSLTRKGESVSGEFTVGLKSFDTGMSTRDNHLKEKVFETSKYETAKLVLDPFKVPNGDGTYKDLPFTGKLNLHGVDHAVSGLTTLVQNGQSMSFKSHLEMKLTDHQIVPPEFMGMSIQDNVKIEVEGEAKSK